jgi:hypothetical protein
MEVLSDGGMGDFGDDDEGFFVYAWCSCSFSSTCVFNPTSGGCNWVGGTCTFGGSSSCNYVSCGNPAQDELFPATVQ